MTAIMIILAFAISGIIGYLFMEQIDRLIDPHASGSDKPERGKITNEHAESGKNVPVTAYCIGCRKQIN